MKTLIKFFTYLILVYLILIKLTFAENKIQIGLIVPLSGEYSEIGQSIVKSTRLAINQINDDRFEIIPEDTKANPIDALKVSKKLQSQGIKIIIGPVFNESTKYLDDLSDITFISLTKFRKLNAIERSIFLIPKTDYKKEIEVAINKTNISLKEKFFYDTDPTILTDQIEKLTRYEQRKKNLEDETKYSNSWRIWSIRYYFGKKNI